jgi:hypothetical protein
MNNETEKQLAEIEEGCFKDNEGKYWCSKYHICESCHAKKQGFLLGIISQLKEEIDFIAHIHSCANGCKSCREEMKLKYNELTAELKEAEDKLKEMEKDGK